MKKVENLSKVTVQLKAGATADRMDLIPNDLEFEFIFGIGSGGMCPFEYQLANRGTGEEIVIQLKREELYLLFEHLRPPIMHLFEKHDALALKIKILRIEKPENTEVIKALSEIAAHHHDCDCGCGC